MSTDDDTELRDMLIQSLEKNGTLAKLRAQLRASVFLALEEQDKVKNKTPLLNEKAHKFVQNNDGRLCCELVVDLLKNLNLDATESVFRPEINLKDLRSRNDLEKNLGVHLTPDDHDQPLLLSLLKSFRHQGSAAGDGKKTSETGQKTNETKAKVNTKAASKSSTNSSTPNKNADPFDDEHFRTVNNDEDDFFGDAGDSKINYAFPGLSTVTERPKVSDKDSKTPSSSSIATDKKSNVVDSKDSLKLSNSGSGSLSFLGDLPDIPKKSGLPPLLSGNDLKKTDSNSVKQQNLMKILGGSFDDIENESPRFSVASNDESPKSPKPTKDAAVSKPKENNSKSTDVGVNKKAQDLFRKRSDNDDDEISEEIVEDLEVDDLLSSARSAHQLSF